MKGWQGMCSFRAKKCSFVSIPVLLLLCSYVMNNCFCFCLDVLHTLLWQTDSNDIVMKEDVFYVTGMSL